MLVASNHVTEPGATEGVGRQPRFHPDGEGIVQQPELLAERIVRGTCDDRRFANEAGDQFISAGGSAFGGTRPTRRGTRPARPIAVRQHVERGPQDRGIEMLFARRRQHAQDIRRAACQARDLIEKIGRYSYWVRLNLKEGTEGGHDVPG